MQASAAALHYRTLSAVLLVRYWDSALNLLSACTSGAEPSAFYLAGGRPGRSFEISLHCCNALPPQLTTQDSHTMSC